MRPNARITMDTMVTLVDHLAGRPGSPPTYRADKIERVTTNVTFGPPGGTVHAPDALGTDPLLPDCHAFAFATPIRTTRTVTCATCIARAAERTDQ